MPATRRWLGVFFPPQCVACGGLIEDGPFSSLCANCGQSLEFVSPPAAVRFAGPARELVLALKYRKRREVLGDIEQVFRRADSLIALASNAVLVPVPLSPLRQRERGFNQAHLIARALARVAPGARVSPLLARVRETQIQASLGRDARAVSVKNAFALAPGARLNSGPLHLIIDDVITTGSTVENCAQALRRAGCARIDVAAFAQG
ncbi:MAG TPA: double zinc ribbon domain-containing protein [Opitutaceae bacterium]